MIKTISLKNFRGFQEHKIQFGPKTIMVGSNNAGKSSIIEALRLISIIILRYKNSRYHSLPSWLDLPNYYRGIKPSLEDFGINFKSIFHQYGDPPATIHAEFTNNYEMRIFVGPDEEFFAVIIQPNGRPINSKRDAYYARLPLIGTLPQISPLITDEKLLTPEYVNRLFFSNLSSRHFRNQIYQYPTYFETFKRISENTWRSLQIHEIESNGSLPGAELSLLVRDNDFVAEVGWMGHGLQMWLQTMWFLSYTYQYNTVILDEPDVYMHADLQKRLIRLIKNMYPQVIIATHSIEIMSEVNPDEILIIDRYKKKSSYANSLKSVQFVINNIGGVHNIQIARLWNARKCLLVEGKDVKILKHIQDKLYKDTQDPLDVIPNMSIGGWGGWAYVVGTSLFLKNSGGDDIATYCILDSDYHTEDEITSRYTEAKKHKIRLHIWRRKEIENYFVAPEVILRILINKGVKNKNISVVMIEQKITDIINQLKLDTCDNIATEIQNRDRSISISSANKKARLIVDDAWKNNDQLSIVSGKKIISLLSQWSQSTFKVAISTLAIAHEMKTTEINDEMKNIINAIETLSTFN